MRHGETSGSHKEQCSYFWHRLTNLHRRAVPRLPPQPALESASPWRHAASTKRIASWGGVLLRRCYLLPAHGCFPFKSMARADADILTISTLCCVTRCTMFDNWNEWPWLRERPTARQCGRFKGNSAPEEKKKNKDFKSESFDYRVQKVFSCQASQSRKLR